tara:strand:- start:7028 stop:7474 length:447 start_codon:yes stop_codon:yes gene_type:complete
MACKTETKNIGDHEYSVTQWSATEAILMKFKLAKTFGASLATLMGTAMEGSKDKKTNDQNEAQALSDGLSVLFQNSSPEDLVTLLKKCVIGTACDGKRITESSFNELFGGDELLEVYKVFVFVLQVNYSNLFKGQLVENFLTKLKVKL